MAEMKDSEKIDLIRVQARKLLHSLQRLTVGEFMELVGDIDAKPAYDVVQLMKTLARILDSKR